MKLSKRLCLIDSLVNQHYDHIWDCCCDHGLLGATLLERNAGGQIHFVDIVPELITSLENKLSEHFGPGGDNHWQVHCLDVARLPLSENPGAHLVIIAGIGGDLMADLITAICAANPSTPLEFLLCPVHHTYSLRQQLRSLDCRVMHECLVEDNRRFYEVLHLATHHHYADGPVISLTGDTLWQVDCESSRQRAQRYKNKLLAHYQRMQLSYPDKVAPIVTAYQAINVTD